MDRILRTGAVKWARKCLSARMPVTEAFTDGLAATATGDALGPLPSWANYLRAATLAGDADQLVDRLGTMTWPGVSKAL